MRLTDAEREALETLARRLNLPDSTMARHIVMQAATTPRGSVHVLGIYPPGEGALRDWQQAEALGIQIPDVIRELMVELEAEFGTSE